MATRTFRNNHGGVVLTAGVICVMVGVLGQIRDTDVKDIGDFEGVAPGGLETSASSSAAAAVAACSAPTWPCIPGLRRW